MNPHCADTDLVGWITQRAGSPQASSPGALRTTRAAMRILADPRVDIQDLADAESLSRRQLERDFARWLGTSPRHLAHVARVHAVSRLARRGESLASAAAGASFADQSQMSRSVRRLTGLTPKRFVHAQATPLPQPSSSSRKPT